MRDVYLTVDIIITIGLILLSAMSLLRKGYKNPSNRLFGLFSILVGFWIISNHVSNDITVPKTIALFADYIVFSSSLGVAIVFMQFVLKLASADKLDTFIDKILPILWSTCILCFTPLIVQDISISSTESVYIITFGSMIWLYALEIFSIVGLIFYGLYHGLRYSNGTKKRQLLAISSGIAVALPLIVLFSFLIPLLTGSFEVTEFGITPLIIVVLCLYYSVVKYQLFDIRLAAVRAMAYALSLATLSVVYYYIAYLVSFILFNGRVDSSVSVSPVNIALALVLAFLFQPVKKFFDRITNKVFYKDNYNTEDFIARLNKSLAVTTDLRSLLEKAAYEIATTLKSDQAFFFISTDINKDHYISDGTDKRRKIPRYDVLSLDKLIDKKKGVLVVSLLDENDPIRRMMLSYDVEMVLPLIQDNVIIGYLFLGHHLTSGYTNRDIKALNTISNELVIAIRNALVIQEIKELNATLQQRINNATRELRSTNATLRQLDKVKDEFVSLASHQLRTPLTSVKGYLSMVLEGDAGKISKAQYQLLNEAFLSSERMVRLISDFLNVSRIQTGKFIIDRTPTDLSVIVEQEMESLKPNAQARNMKLIYKKPKNFPILNLDEGKMRQVIMNFADNAIYYSRDDSDINIKLSIEAGEAVLTVKDTGIGVPKSERDRLFSKFYRASNARKKRPDGTGVGIYLAKKVVNAHDGVIIFESVEGKGSTFGFRLPIKKNS